MNIRKLPKEKRNHLVLVGIFTLMAIVALYFGLIRLLNERLAVLARNQAEAAKKLQVVLGAIHQAGQIKSDLDEAKLAMAAAESDVASGDLYSWVINSLRGFKAPYKVEIPQFSQLSPVADVNLLPNFPYKQATLTVAGVAHYHDLGKFIADFENQFPHTRLVNLTVDANAPSQAGEPESLSFKMEIVTLVKPNAS
jgi:hypothetical protein